MRRVPNVFAVKNEAAVQNETPYIRVSYDTCPDRAQLTICELSFWELSATSSQLPLVDLVVHASPKLERYASV